MFKYSFQYWRFHKRQSAVLFFTIFVCTMSMTVGVFLARSASQGSVEKMLTTTGNYDLIAEVQDESQLTLLEENSNVSEYAVILNGGQCRTEYSEAVNFGAMQGQNAETLYHFQPEKGGRYPLASGEVCAYRRVFQNLGVAPVLGNTFMLELYDTQGNTVGKKELKIVGILNEEDTYYGFSRSLDGAFGMNGRTFLADTNTDIPGVFLWKDDLPPKSDMTVMILCSPAAVPNNVGLALAEAGMTVWMPPQSRLTHLQLLADVVYKTENDLREKAHLSYKDFYSSILIPSFLGIILTVSFMSIYTVMSDAMIDRQRQFGLYRSMGLSMRRVKKMLIIEASVFNLSGVLIGYAAGVAAYAAYYGIMNTVSNIRIYNAFQAHWVANAVSMNPYIYPWLLGLIFSAIAMAFPMFGCFRQSPNEMLFPEKKTQIRQSGNSTKGRSILYKVIGKRLISNVPVTLLIFLTGWVFVFGAAFMLAKADSDNYRLYQQLNEAEGADADYIATKEIYNTMWGNVLFNRHNEGITKEDMSVLLESEDIATVAGVCKLPGLKVICDADDISEEQKATLEPLNIANNESMDFLQELYEKSKSAQGYDEDDLLFKIPSTALDADFLKSLSQYVVSGELDMEGLADGSKIAIVEYPDAEFTNPFSLGDTVKMTDVVIDNQYVECHDFSHNTMPEGVEPTFYYDYTDKSYTNIEGFSFGKKVLFDAEICAILYIDDENLRNMIEAESYVMRKDQKGYVSPGYGILCSTEALQLWGLPDHCYTDVYADLKPNADTDRFELLWYRIVGRSGDVRSIIRNDIKRSIARTDQSNLMLFVSMAVLIVLTGCFGMINSYHFAVSKNMKNLQTLRAVGMSRKALEGWHIRSLFLQPFLAVVTSVIPIAVFDIVKRYANYHAFIENNNFATVDENGKFVWNWAIRFPYYIELWEQPLVFIMIIAFVCMILFNVIAAISPIRHMVKTSIAEGIRTDDF